MIRNSRPGLRARRRNLRPRRRTRSLQWARRRSKPHASSAATRQGRRVRRTARQDLKMATATPAHTDHAHAHDDHAHDHPTGWRRLVASTNHKDIGTMYLVFAIIAGIIGAAMSIMIRIELMYPGIQIFHETHTYDGFVTSHSLIM